MNALGNGSLCCSTKRVIWSFALLALVYATVLIPSDSVGQDIFSSRSTGADGPLVFYSPPELREDHAMAYDRIRNVTVLFGGEARILGRLGGRTVVETYHSTWEWDDTRWTNRTDSLTQFPSKRSAHAMVYDESRNMIVLFGGWDRSNVFQDTWEYDGANWVPKPTANAPTPRYGHAMVYDAGRNVTVLFGGWDGSVLQDTWEYDGTDWTLQSPANTPTPRHLHAMVYDAGRNVTVLFGGNWGSGPLQDTWEYDGTDWTLKTPANAPSERYWHAMAYDSDRSVVVLFGGQGSADFDDTWEYVDGVNWLSKDVSVSPKTRGLHAMTYDADSKQVVMFGGAFGDSLNDTLAWDGTSWSAPTQVQPEVSIDMQEKPDGIWNYTTIDIPVGITLRFTKNARNTPIIWLANGDVNIFGTIVLDGANGTDNVDLGNEAHGGPGGFAGGLGGKRFDVSSSYGGTPGQGPGGGATGTQSAEPGGDGGYATPGNGPLGGSAYGSVLMAPPVGGSGGGGGGSNDSANGGNGGGGGGVILIAASGDINFHGKISADGGAGWDFGFRASRGGKGSGGAIRLIANQIIGDGELSAQPNGRIRLEGFVVRVNGLIQPGHSSAPPIALGLPNSGTIRVDSVAGEVIPANAAGDTASPDVIFTQPGEIAIGLATTNIPVGTVLTVRVTAAGEVLTVESTPINAAGDATARMTVPAGVGTIQAFATYIAP